MAREIKFKVWDNVDYMSNPFTLQDIQEKKIQFTSDCVVMQFTGLHDMNGKEICEDDVVKVVFEEDLEILPELFIVRFKEHGWMPFLEIPIEGERICEVIGNIYEHPNLLS